jgi:hypothetical protein
MSIFGKELAEEPAKVSLWRRSIGNLLAFLGLIICANITLVAILFRQLLSLPTELLFIAVGGVAGVIGLLMRGDKAGTIMVSVSGLIGGVIAMLAVDLIGGRFGFPGILVFLVVIAWSTNRLVSRVDE